MKKVDEDKVSGKMGLCNVRFTSTLREGVLLAVGLAVALLAALRTPAHAETIQLLGTCAPAKAPDDFGARVVTQCKRVDGVEHWSIDRDQDKYTPRIWRLLKERVSGLEGSDFQKYLTNAPDRLPFQRSVALLLGIGAYKELTKGEYKDLDYVDNDVDLMRDTLIKTGLFDDIFIARGGVVTRTLIQSYFEAFSKTLGPKDRLLFYFSGHGTEVTSSGDGALVLPGAQRQGFQNDSILKIKELRDWGDDLKVGHILYLLDSCSSGLGRRSKSSGIYTNDSLDVINALSSRGSRVFITAGTADQETFETKINMKDGTKKGFGIFTWAFVKSWLDRIERKESIGFVTANEIHADMLRLIASETRDLEKKYQIQPDLWRHNEGKYDGTFVLVDPNAKFDASTLSRYISGIRTRGAGASDGEQAQLLLLEAVAEIGRTRHQRALALLAASLRKAPQNAAVRAALAPLLNNITRPSGRAPFGGRMLRTSPDGSKVLAALPQEPFGETIVQYSISHALAQLGNPVGDVVNLDDFGYAADGKTFFVADHGAQARIRVFSVAAGQPLFTYEAPRRADVLSVLPTLEQAWLSVEGAAGNKRDIVRVDLKTGRRLEEAADSNTGVSRSQLQLPYSASHSVVPVVRQGVAVAVDRHTLTTSPFVRLGENMRSARGAEWLADGYRLLVWDENGQVELWNINTGRQISNFRLGTSVREGGVALSPDGRIVAGAEHGGRVAFFDADRGTLISRRKGHDDEVRRIAFSPDGKYAASAGEDGAVVLWDARKGEVRATYRSHRPGKTRFSKELRLFSNLVAFVDGGKILTAGSDGELHLISLFGNEGTDELDPVGQVEASPQGQRWKDAARWADSGIGFSNSLDLSPTGTAATQFRNDTIVIWNLAERRVLHISEAIGVVSGAMVRYTPDGKYALYPRSPSGGAAELIVVDLSTGLVRGTIPLDENFCDYYVPSTLDRVIVAYRSKAVREDGVLRTYDLRSSKWLQPVSAHNPCDGQADGGMLLLTGDQWTRDGIGKIDVYRNDLHSERKAVLDEPIRRLEVKGPWLLARGESSSSVTNLKAATGSVKIGAARSGRFVELSSRGSLMVVDESGDVVFLDGASGQEFGRTTGDQSRYIMGAFVPSNEIELAALAREDGLIEVWDYVLRRKLYDFFATSDHVRSLAYDARTERLFVHTANGLIKTWRIPAIKLSVAEVDALSECYSPWFFGVDLMRQREPNCAASVNETLAKMQTTR